MTALTATLPRHIGIIMDGNGRWACQRGLIRRFGHRAGAEAVGRAVNFCLNHEAIKVLTLYAFSTENKGRPVDEVNALMRLFRRFLTTRIKQLQRDNIRLCLIGDRDALTPELQTLVTEVETATIENSRLTLVLAIHYGGRDEIIRTTRKIASQVARGELTPDAIDENLFSASLDTQGIPDPELIIRTAGEMRMSNFLLWQAAYAEFVALPICWPDFQEQHFTAALEDYAKRTRRFGKIL